MKCWAAFTHIQYWKLGCVTQTISSTFLISIQKISGQIPLVVHAGAGEIILENEHGVLQHPQSDSFSARVNSFTNLRFGSTNTGTDKIIQEDGSNLINETAGSDSDDGVDEFLLEENVDGTTLRISDFTGTTTNPNHKTNLAFPTEVTKSAQKSLINNRKKHKDNGKKQWQQ